MKYKIICSCGHEIIIDVYGETLKHEKKLLFYRENISYIRLMLSLPQGSVD